MGCVELYNFYFCSASIFCQPMKKFEFFVATRATRQRHSKRSSTGDEDALIQCFFLFFFLPAGSYGGMVP